MSVFDDIVVAWNYTYPHYDSIPFLAELYNFPNVLHYGPPGNDSRVIGVETIHGILSYAIFEDAFRRFPGARGVMLVHDDFLLNRAQFERLDVDKAWSQPRKALVHAHKWNWWRSRFGESALENAATVCGPIKSLQYGFSDLMYVPASISRRLIPKFSVYAAKKVFCELAWPNLVDTYLDSDDVQILRTIDHIGCEYGHSDWLSLYKPEYHGIHPVKWSVGANRESAYTLLSRNRDTGVTA